MAGRSLSQTVWACDQSQGRAGADGAVSASLAVFVQPTWLSQEAKDQGGDATSALVQCVLLAIDEALAKPRAAREGGPQVTLKAENSRSGVASYRTSVWTFHSPYSMAVHRVCVEAAIKEALGEMNARVGNRRGAKPEFKYVGPIGVAWHLTEPVALIDARKDVVYA